MTSQNLNSNVEKLHPEIENKINRLELLNRLAESMNKAKKREEIFEEILETTKALFPATKALIYFSHNGIEFTFDYSVRFDGTSINFCRCGEDKDFQKLLQRPRVSYSPCPGQFAPLESNKEKNSIPGSFISLALEKDDERLGNILFLVDIYNNDFSSVDTTYLDTVARLASISLINIKNVELINQNTKDLEEKVYNRTKELQAEKEKAENALIKLKQAQKALIQSEKMSVLGGLVVGVAHEINTPLGNVLMMSSLMRDITKKLQEDVQGDVKGISKTKLVSFLDKIESSNKLVLSSAERAACLVTNFKQVSVDQQCQEKRGFKLRSYIENVLDTLTPSMNKKPINIALDIPSSIELNSFPGFICQIVTHLVMNSVTHAFDNCPCGEIKISSVVEGDSVKIHYSDDGVGMTETQIKNVFDPFYTTNRTQGGTGLGMHIVYNIVTQALAGEIHCESLVGKGVHFEITFPLKIRCD